MIHILNFNDEIIDYISHDDGAITAAKLSINAEEKTETFDFTIDSDRAEFLRERNRVIVQDENGLYREFVITHVDDTLDDVTEVETNASYLEDLKTAKPIPPGSYNAATVTQSLGEVLEDTGWEVSDECEYGGMRTTSWTAYNSPYDLIGQLCTTYSMVADYYIELGSHTVEHRYVSLRNASPVFKGKEITKGKDLTGLTRTVDMTEIKTALIALGPEDENGNRETVIVTDDDAQAQFGLPGRYLWDVYEPESDDTSMTKDRLTTLAKTELNKRKQLAVSYEISSIDIHKFYEDVDVYLHDIVRIKDRDFNPPLYVEAEVTGVEYDTIADESVYKFGNVVEYEESSLRAAFNKRLDDIRKKLNDNVSNINTIVADVVAGQLEYFEPKIIKSDTPPDKPAEDTLWYDTSNPNVAVLRRYHNGEWVNETAQNVKQLGGVTREEALYDSLTNTFQNLAIQHAALLERTTALLNNQYLVDKDLKDALQNATDNLIGVFDHIKSNLDGMTRETATIGNLIDTQALFLDYRKLMQDLYKAANDAQDAADARLKLLQSQYTDEKFNDAMQKVAEGIGGTWDVENKQLIASIPDRTEMENAIKAYTDGEVDKLNELVGEQTDSKIQQAKDELSSNITTVSNKVDNIQVGGRNLLPSYDGSKNIATFLTNTQSFTFSGWAVSLYTSNVIKPLLQPGQQYTLTFDLEVTGVSDLKPYALDYSLRIYDRTVPATLVNVSAGKIEGEVGDKYHVSQTFTATEGNWEIIGYSNLKTPDGTLVATRESDKLLVTNLKLEKGNKATDWTPAPEDTDKSIEEATKAAQDYADKQDILNQTKANAYADGIVSDEEQRAIDEAQKNLDEAKSYADTTKQAAQDYTDNQLKPITATQQTQSSDIKQLKDGITLKADKSEVTTLYDNNIKPLQTQVNQQQSELDVLPDQINSKVSKSDYDTDQNNIVTRLNSADTQRQQLSNEIDDRVTISQFNDVKIGTRNLLMNGGYNAGLSYWRNVGKATPDNVIDTTQTDLPSDLKNAVIIELDDYINNEKGIAQNNLNLTVGKEYVLSAWIKIITGGPTVRLQEGKTRFTNKNYIATTDWQRYEYKFTAVEQLTNVYVNIPKGTANAKIAVTGVQLVEGNKNTDFKLSDKDTDQKLTNLQTQITQNGTDIIARATKDEFNASNKTLSKAIADMVINTTTGITLTYDENGSIQSSTVGPDGVKIKGDRVDISVNKDFQVMTSNVNNKVGKDEVVNRLNLSNEGLNIDVNKVGIRGGDKTTYLTINNTSVLSRGSFTRTWAGTTDTANLTLGIRSGYIMASNEDSGLNCYMTEKGLSTMMSGGTGSEAAGTLEFHSTAFNDNSRGVRLHSTYGAVVMQSQFSRVYTRSAYTTNIETWDASIYFRPFVGTRPGVNEFGMYIKDNTVEAADGCLLFGELSDPNGQAGTGIRFRKAAVPGYADMEPIIYATDQKGNMNAGSFSAESFYGNVKTRTTNLYNMTASGGELRVTDFDGYNGGKPKYQTTRMNNLYTMHSYAFANHSGADVYFGVGTHEMRITDNNYWNSGNPQYKNVRANSFIGMSGQSSSEKYKTNIKEWHVDASQMLRDTVLYEFNYKNKLDTTNHGVVLERETPEHIKMDDNVNINELLYTTTKALQEQISRNDELENRIEKLEAKLNG